MGAVDRAQLFTEATEILADGRVAATESGRWAEVLIDDADIVSGPMGQLLERLAPACLVAAGEGGSGAQLGGARRWFDQFRWPTTVYLSERHRAPLAPCADPLSSSFERARRRRRGAARGPGERGPVARHGGVDAK